MSGFQGEIMVLKWMMHKQNFIRQCVKFTFLCVGYFVCVCCFLKSSKQWRNRTFCPLSQSCVKSGCLTDVSILWKAVFSRLRKYILFQQYAPCTSFSPIFQSEWNRLGYMIPVFSGNIFVPCMSQAVTVRSTLPYEIYQWRDMSRAPHKSALKSVLVLFFNLKQWKIGAKTTARERELILSSMPKSLFFIWHLFGMIWMKGRDCKKIIDQF